MRLFLGILKAALLSLTLSVAQVSGASVGVESVASSALLSMGKQGVDERIYSLVDRLIRAGVYLSLSAVFAGLTIGIMCMDMLTIDIIAKSGPEPDRSYASQILPLRRKGHRTLCTLILTNILMNVLVVQEIGHIMDIVRDLGYLQVVQSAGSNGDAITGFLLSTLVIIVFAEIIPMSICKSKYSLKIAAAGSILVRIAEILVYPAAMPFGMLLDYLVPHDAGQIYDRNELRKLMLLHCEAHGDRSGLVKTEVQLLIAAMDFHEKKVSDIMKPIEEMITVQADEVITREVIEHLWNSGCSRIAVETSPKCYTGVLLVKDLLTIPTPISKSDGITIGELINENSRFLATVHENTSLPTLLKFLQHAKTHMLLVFSADDSKDEVTRGHESELHLYSYYHQCVSMENNSKTVGFITLEDVVEALIKGEIYDEYDHYESSLCDFPNDTGVSVPIRPTWIPMPEPEPIPVPRVNFFSYYVHTSACVPLTEAQVWAVAYYLTRAVKAFYLWIPGYVKMLLDECGDQQLLPPTNDTAVFSAKGNAAGSGPCSSQFSSPRRWNLPESSQVSLVPSTEKPPLGNCRSLSEATDESFVMYREGLQTAIFTLVLSGKLDAVVVPSNIRFSRRSFEWLAEEALTSPCYVPDFDALVLSPTRLYRIPREKYEKFLYYNTIYFRDFEKNEVDIKRTTATTNHLVSQISERSPLGTTQTNSFNSESKEMLLKPIPGGAMYGTFNHAEK